MTFIELVITFSILIMIVSFSFFKINTSKYQVLSYVKQFCADVRYVRNKNMAGNFQTYIVYEQKNNTKYYILVENGEKLKEVGLPVGASMSNSINKIIFRYDGSLNGIGETIKIMNDKKEVEITIVPFSGRVLFKEGAYE